MNKLRIKLVNFEKNRENLKDIPYLRFLDLAIIPYIPLKETKDGTMTIILNRDMLGPLNMSETELKKIMGQLKNKGDYYISSLLSPFEKIPYNEMDRDIGFPVLLISKKGDLNGATAILNNNVLKKVADTLEDDIFIIPSSVHEVLILPVNGKANDSGVINELKAMISEVNKNEVDEKDFLSDSLYIYSRSDGEVSFA